MPRSLISCYESIDRALDSPGARRRTQRRRPAAGARDARQARALEHDRRFSSAGCTSSSPRSSRTTRGCRTRFPSNISSPERAGAPMRIRISHEIAHRYAPPARMVIQNLRLTPHGFDSQYVLGWRINLDIDSALRQTEDAHGNVVSTFSHHGRPVERLTVVGAAARSRRAMRRASCAARSNVCRRRCICATARSPMPMARCATLRPSATAGASDPLDALHRLMTELNRVMAFDPVRGGRSGIGGRGLRAAARAGARLRPYLHRLRALPRHSGALHRRLSRRGRGRRRAGRASPGPRPTRRSSAGSPSTRPPASAPTSAMCAWSSASTPGTRRFVRSSHGGGEDAVEMAIRVEQAGVQTQA